MFVKMYSLILGGMVLILTTGVVAYTAAVSVTSASCSTSVRGPQYDDSGLKRFLQGDRVPMEGGKRY